VRAGDQLGKIVAGDVLHHLAARLEEVATAGDGAEAKHMVASGAGLDATRAAGIDRDRAADRAGAIAAPEPARVHRLEGELLGVLVEQRGDLVDGRARPSLQHELGRLVHQDAGEARNVELGARLDRVAEAAL